MLKAFALICKSHFLFYLWGEWSRSYYLWQMSQRSFSFDLGIFTNSLQITWSSEIFLASFACSTFKNFTHKSLVMTDFLWCGNDTFWGVLWIIVLLHKSLISTVCHLHQHLNWPRIKYWYLTKSVLASISAVFPASLAAVLARILLNS